MLLESEPAIRENAHEQLRSDHTGRREEDGSGFSSRGGDAEKGVPDSQHGKNVEIRRDVDGKPKVFKVSREIEK